MKLASQRFQALKGKIQNKLVASINASNPDAEKHLRRLNIVLCIQRARNIKNGMPGSPWVDVPMSEVLKKLGK